MAEIKIKVDAMDTRIKELKTLKSEISANTPKPPPVVGGGSCVNELEKMAKMYKTLNASLSVLVSNTISFMSNVKDSYVSSDEKASKKIATK